MKAIVFAGAGTVSLVDAPDPDPAPGWARVRVKAAAVCMTDFEVLRGTIAAQYPLTPGHEWSGVVEAVGSGADGAWLGRRVSGDNEITCLECWYCRRGQWRRCPQYQQIGFQAAGAYAEYVHVPVRNLHELAASISFEQGALLEPLGVGLAVAAMAEARVASAAIVLGVGPIGLNCLAALRASGARRILCLDRQPARLQVAKTWGAAGVYESADELRAAAKSLHAHGTDIVVDATGHPEMLRLGAELARFGGTFALAGYFGGSRVEWHPDMIHERNVRVLGAGNNTGFTETAALAAADGLVRTESMITHRFRLNEYTRVFSGEMLREPSYIKGVFLP